MATKNQLAVIHILKKEYDLSDNEYTDLMWNLFDETTSRHLDEEQADKFIHALNYKYNESYKRGYDRAISEVCGKDLDTQFRFFYRDRFEKEPTNLELYLFGKLDDEQKSDTINDLKKQF